MKVDALNVLTLYMNEVKSFSLLTEEEEKELGYRLLQNDNGAKKELIERNLRLVVKIAYKYIDRGASLEDLIQEGNLGLIRATDKYDVTKNVRFSTYATYWIHQFIEAYLIKMAHTSNHTYAKIMKYKRAYCELQDKLGRNPTKKELADSLEVTMMNIEQLEKIINDNWDISGEVINSKGDVVDVASLMIDDENMLDNIMKKNMKDEVGALLEISGLTSKERDVIRKLFGFMNDEKYTLTKLADEYHVTVEAIRQTEIVALNKMRKKRECMYLAVYLNHPDKGLERLRELKYSKRK